MTYSNKICCESMNHALGDKQLPVCITNEEDCYGKGIIALKWRYNEICTVVPIYFCPWCGVELEQAKICSLKHKVAFLSKDTPSNIFDNSFDIHSDIPDNLKYLLESDDWMKIDNKNRRDEHRNEGICYELEYAVNSDIPIIYRENLRAFGILHGTSVPDNSSVEEIRDFKYNNKFIPINYCYYCGDAIYEALLVDQLDKILREEYGLNSWKDYRKAPEEFHTYEWWKKRGL